LTADLQARSLALGVPQAPLLVPLGDFPRRESKVLGFVMVTQNIVLDFDTP